MEQFFADLAAVAPAAGEQCYAFMDAERHCRGWVQLVVDAPQRVILHRLWTLHPGQGNGSMMLRTVCELADRHAVEIRLKVIPIGRKPYPFDRAQLVRWYQRHGFVGTHRKMIRTPVQAPPT